MALVYEDGTGKPNAESYASVEYFINHHNGRGNDISAYDAVKIEQGLRKGTDYMESRWTNNWVGIRHSFDQALAWPRDGAFYPDDGRFVVGVPIEVKKACCEYALRALQGTLNPDIEYTSTNGILTVTEDRVGPIMQHREYQGGVMMSYRKFPTVDSMLKPLLVGGSGSGYLERV